MRSAARRIGLAAGVIGLLASAAGRPEAATVTFTSSAAFNAAIAGYGTTIENYSGFTKTV
jgi:hypothetical protein